MQLDNEISSCDQTACKNNLNVKYAKIMYTRLCCKGVNLPIEMIN